MEEGRRFFIIEERPDCVDVAHIVTKDLMVVIETALYRWRYNHSPYERRHCNFYYVCSMIERVDDNGNWHQDSNTMKDYVDIIELEKRLRKRKDDFHEKYPDDYYTEEAKDIELYLKERG